MSYSYSPKITKEMAIQIAKDDRSLTQLEGIPSAKFCILPPGAWGDKRIDKFYLVWIIGIRGIDPFHNWVYIIDAHSGEVLLFYNNNIFFTSEEGLIFASEKDLIIATATASINLPETRLIEIKEINISGYTPPKDPYSFPCPAGEWASETDTGELKRQLIGMWEWISSGKPIWGGVRIETHLSTGEERRLEFRKPNFVYIYDRESLLFQGTFTLSKDERFIKINPLYINSKTSSFGLGGCYSISLCTQTTILRLKRDWIIDKITFHVFRKYDSSLCVEWAAETDTSELKKKLIGMWEWVNSFRDWRGVHMETPQSTGEERKLAFREPNFIYIYDRESLLFQGTFTLSKDERLIKINPPYRDSKISSFVFGEYPFLYDCYSITLYTEYSILRLSKDWIIEGVSSHAFKKSEPISYQSKSKFSTQEKNMKINLKEERFIEKELHLVFGDGKKILPLKISQKKFNVSKVNQVLMEENFLSRARL